MNVSINVAADDAVTAEPTSCQPIHICHLDMANQVNERRKLATSSMNWLDFFMSKMNNNNCGVHTAQMLNSVGGFMVSIQNVEDGVVM